MEDKQDKFGPETVRASFTILPTIRPVKVASALVYENINLAHLK